MKKTDEKIFEFPNGTQFSFLTEKKTLTLRKLFGLTCGMNGCEDDDSRSGLALLGIDAKRLEGALLQYECGSAENEFHFSATDVENSVRLDAVWQFHAKHEIILCRYTLTNTSAQGITVRRAFPRMVFSSGDYEVYSQQSRWNNESQGCFQSLFAADLVLHARPGRSTVGATPFCMLRDKETCNGVAFHVIPHGNWMIKIHADLISNEAVTPVVEAGLADTDLFLELQPGESLALPELLLQHAADGTPEGLAAPLQRYLTEAFLPRDFTTPPVVYNTWLYHFTNFTREQLHKQLQSAKKIGCEVFVVDAGWFGYDDSWGMVGDWREKPGAPFFGNMKSFADEVRAAGLKFGFWMEPERWAPGIPIRTEHPEWFPENSSRIDLTIPEAAEYFYHVIADHVRHFDATYIKIDFNASLNYDKSGSELYYYMTVLLAQMKRLQTEFPHLVIENCGSGSLRQDIGLIPYYRTAFGSDNAHPYETLRIRQGAAMRFLSSTIYNWAVIRPAPERLTKVSDNDLVLACGAATWDEGALFNLNYVMLSVLFGIPGFTGDLAGFDDAMLAKIAKYVAFYKANRSMLYRSHTHLLTPAEPIRCYENNIAFQVQSEDETQSLLFAYSHSASRRTLRNFRLKDLDPKKTYQIERIFPESSLRFSASGESLMANGAEIALETNMHIRYVAALYRVTAKD